jgi:hypothetical protein
MAASQLDKGRETQQQREAAHVAMLKFSAEQQGNTRALEGPWKDYGMACGDRFCAGEINMCPVRL